MRSTACPACREMELEIAVDGAALTAASRAPSRPRQLTFREVFAVRERPAAARPAAPSRSPLAQTAAGVRLVFGDRSLRTLMLPGRPVAFCVAPMGLAAPYADSFRASFPIPISTGLVFAAGPFGTAVGAVVLGRRGVARVEAAPDGPAGGRGLRPAAVLAAARPGRRPSGPRRLGRVRVLPVGGQRRLRRPVPPERRGRAFAWPTGHAGVTGPCGSCSQARSRPPARSCLPSPSPSAAA